MISLKILVTMFVLISCTVSELFHQKWKVDQNIIVYFIFQSKPRPLKTQGNIVHQWKQDTEVLQEAVNQKMMTFRGQSTMQAE